MVGCRGVGFSGLGVPAGPSVASVGAVLRAGVVLSVRRVVRVSGRDWQREQALEDRLDVTGPGPVGREVQPASAAAVGEGGRGVEDAVLQGGRFGTGQGVVAAE